MNNRINNIIEVAWIVREEYGLDDKIECISLAELKELIVKIVEKFEEVYKNADWSKLDYYVEIVVFVNREMAQYMWNRLEEVSMNPETECIEESWNGFPTGTHRKEIWHWFERTFHVSVAEDLLGQ